MFAIQDDWDDWGARISLKTIMQKPSILSIFTWEGRKIIYRNKKSEERKKNILKKLSTASLSGNVATRGLK